MWPVEKRFPENINEYNKMINTILIEMFPKNVDPKFKPLVLVHSKLVLLNLTLNSFLFVYFS